MSSTATQCRRKIMLRNGPEVFPSEELLVLAVLHLVNLKLNLGKHNYKYLLYVMLNFIQLYTNLFYVHFSIQCSESRRSSLVEIQEETEEDSSNTDNSKDYNGSMEFDVNKVPDVTSFDDNNPIDSLSKESKGDDDSATNVFHKRDDEKKRFSRPKSILKNSEKLRRGSTP